MQPQPMGEAAEDMVTHAERRVLEAVLFDSRAISEVNGYLEPRHFKGTRHRAVYALMLEMAQKCQVFNDEDLAAYAEAQAIPDAKAIASFIRDVGAEAFTDKTIAHHARIVARDATRRQRLAIVQTLAEQLHSEPMNEDAWESAMHRLMSAKAADRSRRVIWGREAMRLHFKTLETRHQARGRHDWVKTGFAELDQCIGGFEGGTLNLIAARPGMGKSALAGMVAQNVALRENKRVIFFSQEMGFGQVIDRLLASEAMVPARRVRDGAFMPQDWGKLTKAMESVTDNYGVFIGSVSLSDVRSEIVRAKAGGGVDLVIVDYLQIMQASRSPSREREVAQLAEGLKEISVDLNVPVIALSQLNRECEKRADKRPALSDIRESGSIEQAIDIALMVHRESYYDERADPNEVEVSVAKNRNGEAGKVVKLKWLPAYLRIENGA